MPAIATPAINTGSSGSAITPTPSSTTGFFSANSDMEFILLAAARARSHALRMSTGSHAQRRPMATMGKQQSKPMVITKPAKHANGVRITAHTMSVDHAMGELCACTMPEQAIAAIAMQKPPTTSKALSTTVGSPLADSEGALGEAGSEGARVEGIQSATVALAFDAVSFRTHCTQTIQTKDNHAVTPSTKMQGEQPTLTHDHNQTRLTNQLAE